MIGTQQGSIQILPVKCHINQMNSFGVKILQRIPWVSHLDKIHKTPATSFGDELPLKFQQQNTQVGNYLKGNCIMTLYTKGWMAGQTARWMIRQTVSHFSRCSEFKEWYSGKYHHDTIRHVTPINNVKDESQVKISFQFLIIRQV